MTLKTTASNQITMESSWVKGFGWAGWAIKEVQETCDPTNWPKKDDSQMVMV